jgi:hypothetical protein
MKTLVKFLLCGMACLGAVVCPARAGVVRSPNIGQVSALDRMTRHELRWIPSQRALVATVTFSNVDFVSRDEPRRDQRLDFYLPGVRFDATNGIFYDPQGVPVAALHRQIIGFQIRLLPGAKIWIANRSGTLHLALTATEAPRPGLRWVQSNRTDLLPNLFG